MAQLGFDFSGRDAKGARTNFAEANHAINCMDEQRLSEQQGNELRAAIFTSTPFMDPGVVVSTGAPDGCEHWPAAHPRIPVRAQNVHGSRPTG
ncbi:hypothetical protein O7626_04970 [Micromonospora sp. WMMD1102]|uniref:hypothetical protein n=1 Tax=Micromonospora sp. WMMD1102 TaxID=3016105 RepID=UPI002415789C|nr:hypothetical protein [Micromonospora sp. WMMD1102]MDG4785288.1 hypothetical protein [Micromonospora sp. WMMD1102]